MLRVLLCACVCCAFVYVQKLVCLCFVRVMDLGMGIYACYSLSLSYTMPHIVSFSGFIGKGAA